MNDIKHTPGEWSADGKRIFSSSISIAKTYGKNAEKDAIFIVTACNSHEALRDALRVLLAQVDERARQTGWPDNAPREQARAALALAEKGQP